jgi:hypothetical protein
MGEEFWADVLADPRAGKRERRTDLALKQAFYRLADERREIILVACSKCDWRAVFSRERTTRCPTYATISPRRVEQSVVHEIFPQFGCTDKSLHHHAFPTLYRQIPCMATSVRVI